MLRQSPTRVYLTSSWANSYSANIIHSFPPSSYFAESCHADNPRFRATLCDSWESFQAGECEGNEQLDFGIDDYGAAVTEGMYFMNVTEDPPYALG